jgi:hypothetical protein
MTLTINQRYYMGAAAVILAVFAGIVVAYPQLPSTVPIDSNLRRTKLKERLIHSPLVISSAKSRNLLFRPRAIVSTSRKNIAV